MGNERPELTSVTVKEDKIVLTFNEELDPDSVPREVQFVVKINDDSPRVKEVEITDTKVTLTLPYPVIMSDSVHVLYSRPTIRNRGCAS